MLKVVIDTNSLIQMLGAKSPYHFLFTKFLSDEFTLCVSTEILLEYEEILKEKASANVADLFMKVILYSRNIIRKEPYYKFNIIKSDVDDNKFVDCAIVSQADFIVTDDGHFKEVALTPFPKVDVISLEE